MQVTTEKATKKREQRKEAKKPTQEAAEAIKEKEKKSENLKKEPMKRQKGDLSEAGKVESVMLDSSNKACGVKTSTKTKNPKAPKEKRKKKAPLPQGRRKVPTPGDESGCKHRGLRELDVCDKAWIAAYVKVGAWLHKKPCIDCAAIGERVETATERVMDASMLLLLKQPNVAYICNCGPIGHKMEEGEEGKDEYQCDMMLCLPCYSERESKMDAGSGGKRKRKPKTNSY